MRARVFVGIAVAMGAGAGCGSPQEDQPELRADGPPDVLAVLVARDRFLPSSHFLEEATFCRLGDSKRPGRVVLPLPDTLDVDVCPAELGEGAPVFEKAFPAFWYARVVFDEQLDLESEPDEERVASARGVDGSSAALADEKAPVLLNCNGLPVAYSTVYTGAGNRQSWPLGPSLRIRPQVPSAIPAGATCEITLNDAVIFDKQGEPPQLSQLGPYRFKVAPIGLQIPYGAAAAAYGTSGVPPFLASGNPPFRLNFNAYLKPGSFTASDVRVFRGADRDDPQTELTECGGGTEVQARVRTFEVPAAEAGAVPAAMTIADNTAADGDWAAATYYRVEIFGEVEDVAGGKNALALTTLCFRTR